MHNQGDCADGTPMDSQSELELGKHYEGIRDFKKYHGLLTDSS